MMRSKKILTLLLSALLLCSIGAAAVYAVNSGSTGSSTTAFTDVPADAWYAEAANWCHANGIISGMTDTTFSPDDTMNRAMLAAVLYRAAGSPAVTAKNNFSDVANGVYYEDAAAWASENAIITGYGNGFFGSADPVTREQIAAILWRYAGSPEAARAEAFADAADISHYAADAVNWVRSNGIMGGVENNRFDPSGDATRAQVAAILYCRFPI